VLKIFKEFSFEAAHRLPNVPSGHKCFRLHGHSFALRISVEGDVGAESGWVMDFSDISNAFEPILKQLDHYYLNEIEGLENPTSENVARWIWERLQPGLPQLSEVEIRETCTSGCSYQGK
jgi:6-pyruvoyltetrahydropterin/6-carboxytetrahydropterin synthase|tara:strand:+ start:1192 stop:1551 length:360 start_codon:yes stop_codon:yes gene_type:complete